MDTRLDQNEAELGVAVLSVPLQVFADGHGLLDEEVQVLGQLRGQALLLQDAEDLVARHEANLSNAVRVPQDDTCAARMNSNLMGC